MLDERKRKILREIVDEYIDSAEPVSSAVIVEKYEQDISSATVRNDMAELEKAGYLEKPHTSAGRIPSAKGYRLYVDELLKYDNISLEEIRYIQEKLETKASRIRGTNQNCNYYSFWNYTLYNSKYSDQNPQSKLLKKLSLFC